MYEILKNICYQLVNETRMNQKKMQFMLNAKKQTKTKKQHF